MSGRSKTKSDASSPLTSAAFHILLALTDEDRHGLGIADDVENATDGAMRLGPGTLYRTLKEMTRDKLVSEVRAQDPDGDPRRKFYRITARGRRVVEAEARRYERIVRVAQGRDVLPDSR